MFAVFGSTGQHCPFRPVAHMFERELGLAKRVQQVVTTCDKQGRRIQKRFTAAT